MNYQRALQPGVYGAGLRACGDGATHTPQLSMTPTTYSELRRESTNGPSKIITGAVLKPLVRSNFVGIYRQKSTKSSKIDF